MATKKTPGTARYRVLRDTTVPAAEPGGQGEIALAGDIVELDPDTAALMVRDGMVTLTEEG
jgi:hypothetical protein